MPLLTMAQSNAKTNKNQSVSNKYLSAILHLAPSDLSGYNVCPAASMGCKMACLNTAGRGRFQNIQNARIRKTLMFAYQRDLFMNELINDISKLEVKAKKQNLITVIRLNGTSDIDWENIPIHFDWGIVNIFELFPDVQFYDYTKIASRAIKWGIGDLPENYHLTFSRSEVNEKVCRRVLNHGGNVAIVYRDNLPETDLDSFRVINGDTHDLRFLDDKNVIVGLTAKGKAKHDETGFVKGII